MPDLGPPSRGPVPDWPVPLMVGTAYRLLLA